MCEYMFISTAVLNNVLLGHIYFHWHDINIYIVLSTSGVFANNEKVAVCKVY